MFRYVSRHLKDCVFSQSQVSIAITGAFRPASMQQSDAPLNIGMCLAAVVNCQASFQVMLCINGCILDPEDTWRDENGVFLMGPKKLHGM